MQFPVPVATVTTDSDGRTPTDYANEAVDRRRAAQMHSQREYQPQMITQASPPSEAELTRERNKRLKREGDGVIAFRRHLEAIECERESVVARLSYLRGLADTALREGNSSKVREFRAKIEDATVQADRLDLLEADARTGLARAERQEASQREALAAQVQAAERTLASYLKAHATLDKHFQAIAEVVSLESEAETAHRLLQDAARLLPDRSPPAPLPRGRDGRALRVSVTIPGFCSPPARRPTANDAYARD